MKTERFVSNQEAIRTIREAARRWQSTFVPMTQIPNFTGNLYSVGHMANCYSRGDGVEGAFRLGRQVCYPVEKLADWLISRLEEV